MVPALALDLDGVVRTWPVVPSLNGLYDVAFEPELLARVVTGVLSDQQWRAEVTRRLGRSGPELVRRWSTLRGVVDAEVVAVVAAYPGPTALLTNGTSRLSADLDVLGLTGRFDVVINSSDIGVAKPARGAYEHLIAALARPAHEIRFVDDTQLHVDGALAAGLDAHLYSGAAALQELTVS